jgi:hypothetical protein
MSGYWKMEFQPDKSFDYYTLWGEFLSKGRLKM